MKTANTNLSNKEAQAQLKYFSSSSLICSLVGIVIFWWLGIVAVAFGARSVVLYNHKGNKDANEAKKYLAMAVVGIVIGLADIVLSNLSSFSE